MKPFAAIIATPVAARAAICIALQMLAVVAVAQQPTNQQRATAPIAPGAIYKLVDASGKITYTNTPLKGAVKVELDPITVIPASPSASLGDAANATAATAAANVQSPPPMLIPVQPITPVSATPSLAPPLQVAIVTPVGKAQSPNTPTPRPEASVPNLPVVKLSPNLTQGLAPATSAAAAPVVALAPSAESLAQQRRDELKQRNLNNEMEREEQLLAEAKTQLTEEKRASASFRSLRAGLAAKPDSSNPQAAAIKADIKAQVERHFERVRDLEDQVTMHQRNLDGLRQQARNMGIANR
jgi:hypothetical protein